MRRQKIKFKTLSPEQLAKAFARQRQAEADRRATKKLQAAIGKFRPRKADFGKIVFVGRNGSREAANTSRVGYAVYINRKGKKQPVRQFDRKSLRVERVAKAKRLSEIDISRIRSKRAKQAFLEAHTTEISRSQTIEKSRYGFRRNFRRIDAESEFAGYAAKELLKILRGIRSTDRNLALEIGVWVKTPDGDKFIETQLDTLPGDLRKAKIASITEERIRAFFGKQVYAFIASEMAAQGYVMAGSANFVKRLPENKGKSRSKWTKQGHIWQGIEKTDVTVTSVEWRFLQLTFTNR